MYFGSVRFFRNLISAIVVLLIIVSVILITILTIENNELKDEIVQLNAELSAYQTEPVPPPPPSTRDAARTSPVNYSTSEPTSETPPEPEPPESPYVGLLPGLYAQDHGNPVAEGMDDPQYIYLTFDDGPVNNTAVILDYLRDFGVTATFFVVPREGTDALLNRILDEGHSLGIHCSSHDYSVIYESVEAYIEHFAAARNMIYEQTGYYSDIFRFPGGSINDYNEHVRDDIIMELSRRGFVYYDWNVTSGDLGGASWQQMYDSVRRDVANNYEHDRHSIILFHDTGQYTTWVLDNLIEAFLAHPNGYVFGRLDLNVKPIQWA